MNGRMGVLVHKRRRFDSLEQEAYLSLWRTYDRLRALEDALFERYGLTAQQYNVLRLLKAARPRLVPTLALAERLVSRAPDITRILDRLEARGLIVRQRSAENRRIVNVGITTEGLALLRSLARPVRVCAQQQLGHLDPTQLRLLVDLLHLSRAPHEDPLSPWQ